MECLFSATRIVVNTSPNICGWNVDRNLQILINIAHPWHIWGLPSCGWLRPLQDLFRYHLQILRTLGRWIFAPKIRIISSFAYNPASFNLARTFRTCFQWSLLLLEYIKMSSIWTTQTKSKYSLRVSFMNLYAVAGAFVSPKGITRNSNNPYRLQNAVFHSSPSWFLI